MSLISSTSSVASTDPASKNYTQGIVSEIEFVSACIKKGIICCKPVADIGYDVVTTKGSVLKRVQIKSTSCKCKRKSNSYIVNTTKGYDKAYKGYEFDILAVHVVPEDSWFLIPINKIINKKKIRITSFRINKGWKSKFDGYKENWRCLIEKV